MQQFTNVQFDDNTPAEDDYNVFWLVSRRGWFKVTPVAVFKSEERATEYASWLSEQFHAPYPVQRVAQAD